MKWELMALMRELIGFNTVSRNSNMELIGFLETMLKSIGMEVWIDHSSVPQQDGHAHHGDPATPKANLFATLGPRDEPGLMLSGHTDVVPVDGQAWDTDPFTLVSKDGKHYGRGTADMKGFIAQCLIAAHAIQHQKLKIPLHLAFTYDEEIGCFGARHLANTLTNDWHVTPRCSLIGEPSNFQVFRMHKGFHAVNVEITGVEGHSSKPYKGANAIKEMALVIAKLAEIERERQEHPTLEGQFEVPHTTINVAMISGGNAMNIIPNHTNMQFEYRPIPGEDPMYVLNQLQGYVKEVLLPDFKKQNPLVDIKVELLHHAPALMTPKGCEIESLMLELTGTQESSSAPYYTEAAIYSEANIPTVICGPGDIDQAHRPNEYVTDAQLQQGTPFLAKLIDRMCF